MTKGHEVLEREDLSNREWRMARDIIRRLDTLERLLNSLLSGEKNAGEEAQVAES